MSGDGIRSNKAAGVALTVAGALTSLVGLILETTYVFPEIEQVGDLVLIGQNRWTIPALAGGAAMAVLGLLRIFGKRPRRRKTAGVARPTGSQSPAPAKD